MRTWRQPQPHHDDTIQQITDALAKVTQLQRLPQAKPGIFKGDESDTKFFIWETAFDALIGSAPISAQQKLYLLYQHLDGKAKKTVEQLQFMVGADPNLAYEQARTKLRQRFGRSSIIATDFERKLSNWPKIGNSDAQGLREFGDFLEQVSAASQHLSSLKIFEYPSKLQSLVEKLPAWFQSKWSSRVQKLQQENSYDSFPSFADFVQEVTFHADRMNIPQIARQHPSGGSYQPSTSTPSPMHANRRRQPGSAVTLATKAEDPQKDLTNTVAMTTVKQSQPGTSPPRHLFCPYHKKNTHSIDTCKKFRELPIAERKDFFLKNKLCYKCAKQDSHLAAQCKATPPECNECHKQHLTALHDETPPTSKAASACTQVCGREEYSRSCARIVLVKICHQSSPSKEILTHAVLDDQSTDVFITDSLQEELQVSAPELDLKVNTIVGSNTIRTKKVTGLLIQDTDGNHPKIKIPYAYTREYIPATQKDIATQHIVRQWKHLATLADKIPNRPDVDIGMLIGRNVPAAFQPVSVISGGEDEPWAEQYKLGWTVIGRVCKDKLDDSTNSKTSLVNCVVIEREVLLENEHDEPINSCLTSQSVAEAPFVNTVTTKDITSPIQLREMMELDYNELKHCRKIRGTEQAESIEDKRFIDILTKEIHKTPNGNWEAPLPFKTDEVILPNNKRHCLKRLISLKRKLISDEKVKCDYLAFIKKIFDRGHASLVPPEKLHTEPGKVWYLPHFGVYHPKKPDQIRVVFDCSAVYQNESLNQHLLQGPDQLNSLIGVLTRFRKEEVAIMCDIEQMFHSFFVSPEHRSYLRFLWFENNDLSGPILEYQMDVHLFGATSSPGVANFCLHQTAETNRAKYGDEAANFLLKDFYVDDGLISVPTTAQAIKIVKDAQQMCAATNLRLHKFASNNAEVLEALPTDDRAKDLKDLDIRKDSIPIQRSLGTYWCIESDTFGFRIELKDKPLTRRGILSTVSSVYDPLGAVSPVILVGKQILQSLCRENTDWDDPVPDNILPQWEKWRTELPLLENLKFSRCLKPPGFGTPVSTEIHSFSDASDTGIGQVSYLRLTNAENEHHVSFLMGKSRVAPLKPISIPRLELTAAVMSVNVTSMLSSELNIADVSSTYHTDSEIVLGYINNDARRFHVYVSNRVQHIRDRSSPDQWHHVAGKDNPADEASRGLTAKELIENQRWFNGPDFLQQASPIGLNEQSNFELDPTDDEVRKHAAVALSIKSNEQRFPGTLEPERFQHISSLDRLVLAIVRIQRMIESRRPNKQYNWRPKEGVPSVNELQQARLVIVQSVQRSHFQPIIDTLSTLEGNETNFENCLNARKRNATIKPTSNLYKLDPFLDDKGTIRVGGRLKNSSSPFEVKHPTLMPKDDHVTVLLVRHYHHGEQHQGYGITHNAIRQAGYHIINGRSVVSSTIAKCVLCRKQRGKFQEQKMSDLPPERVEPSPPFTYSGMDVFGPFMIKEGRKELKRWGLIFTCLASRAIHLESLNSMSTESFINALRRFIARRGKVRQIRSDQGTNFVGAKNELAAALGELDQEPIKQFLSSQDCDIIDFKMNVPHASHMGGIWERQIRTTRSALTSLLHDHGTQLDDESFRTLLTEAENIVNGRPLTVENLTDPQAGEPLTPNQLLTLKTQVVLPPPGHFDNPDLYSRKRWRRVQYLANQFWLRWQKEYRALFQRRQRWTEQKRNMEVGDVVLVCDAEQPRNRWPLAIVTKVYVSKDQLVRKVQICTTKDGTRRCYDRPVQKLILLIKAEQRN